MARTSPTTFCAAALLLAALAGAGFSPISFPAGLLLLTLAPGWLALRLTGLDRGCGRMGQVVLSVALSITLAPVPLDWLWRVTNQPLPLLAGVVSLLLAAGWVPGLRTMEDAPPAPRPSGFSRVLLAMIAGIVVFATVGAYWPAQVGERPVPALIHDYIKHHAVLFSLQERPLPLGNPFFSGEAAGPTYYYHLFYLIPATLRTFAPAVSIALAFGVHAALVALSIAGVAYLLVRRLTEAPAAAALAAALMTVIGGYDIVPVLAMGLKAVTLDTWADPLMRVHSLLTQMVWTPQNVQAVLIALVVAYVLSARGLFAGWLVLGPLFAACAIGSSIWVSAALAPGAAIFFLIELARAPRGARLRLLLGGAGAALLALALSTPSLLGYIEMARRHTQGGLTWRWDAHASHAWLGRFAPPGVLANLLDLPWWLAIEFGPLLILPLLVSRASWRRIVADRGLRLLLLSALAGLVGFVSVRSDFTYNDFGQKIIMLPMLTGALIGAWALAPSRGAGRLPRWRVIVLAGALLLGAPVGLFQSPVAVLRRFVREGGPLRAIGSADCFQAAREAGALAFLRDRTPTGAVVQGHWGASRLLLCQMVNRQIGVTALERDTEVFQPRDAAAHEAALVRLREAMNTPDAAGCHAALASLGVGYVLVGEIERSAWTCWTNLDDGARFEQVYADENDAVYRVR